MTASVQDVLRLEQVGKTYRTGRLEYEALRDISLRIRRGDFWAIMGSSGSGKSTLLNILGCLDRPTSGRYFLADREVEALPDPELSRQRLHHLGFIFQSFHLIPQLTVLENIELPMVYAHRPAAECSARARELAEMVGLGGHVRHRPMELSGGQRQRVAIARALANNPPVILADEPTGNLDSRTGVQIMDLLVQLNREGRTIIMVTHEQEIAAYARHRLHLRDGRIDRVEEA